MADGNSSENRKKTLKAHNKDHNLRKRPPQKQEIAENVIYVSTKSNIKGLQERCSKLILKGEEEIIVYCLGAAIQRGILLALQVCEKHVAYGVSTSTLTTDLIDDLEPATDDADYEIQRRQNSALRLTIRKSDLLQCSSQSTRS